MAGIVSLPLLSQGKQALYCCCHFMSEAQHPLLHCTFISSCQILALVGCDQSCKKEVASPQYVVMMALHIWPCVHAGHGHLGTEYLDSRAATAT
jgi:uncharacterized metal-binding protein